MRRKLQDFPAGMPKRLCRSVLSSVRWHSRLTCVALMRKRVHAHCACGSHEARQGRHIGRPGWKCLSDTMRTTRRRGPTLTTVFESERASRFKKVDTSSRTLAKKLGSTGCVVVSAWCASEPSASYQIAFSGSRKEGWVPCTWTLLVRKRRGRS